MEDIRAFKLEESLQPLQIFARGKSLPIVLGLLHLQLLRLLPQFLFQPLVFNPFVLRRLQLLKTIGTQLALEHLALALGLRLGASNSTVASAG